MVGERVAATRRTSRLLDRIHGRRVRARAPVLDHPRVAGAVGVVDVDEPDSLVVGGEGDRQQALLAAARHLVAQVEERGGAGARRRDDLDPAGLLDDEQVAAVARRLRHVERLVEVAELLEPHAAHAVADGRLPGWVCVTGGGAGGVVPVEEEDPPPHPASATVAASRPAASFRRLSLPRRRQLTTLPLPVTQLLRGLGRDRGNELAVHRAAVGRHRLRLAGQPRRDLVVDRVGPGAGRV